MSGAPENLAVHAVNPDEDEAEPGNLETSRVWHKSQPSTEIHSNVGSGSGFGMFKLIVGVFFVSWEITRILNWIYPPPSKSSDSLQRTIYPGGDSYWMGGRFGHVLSFEIGCFRWAVFGCKTIAAWSRCACFDEMRRKQIDIGKLKVSFSEQTGD